MIAGFHLRPMMPMIISTRSTGPMSFMRRFYTRFLKCAWLTFDTDSTIVPRLEVHHGKRAGPQPVERDPARQSARHSGAALAPLHRADDRRRIHGHTLPLRVGGGESPATPASDR